jgi:acetyltransferase-like isoleucine patch superfamily enzyme
MKNNNELCLLGAGGFSFDLIACFYNELIEYEVINVLDDNRHFDDFNYNGIFVKYGGIIEENISKYANVIIPFGDFNTRKYFFNICERKKVHVLSLISSEARLGLFVSIGSGSIVFPGAFIGSYCKLEEGVIVQLNSVVGHDSLIGSFTRVDCGALIVGGSRIGSECYIHSNAVVGHNVELRKGSILSAGTFAHKSTEEGETVFLHSKYIK